MSKNRQARMNRPSRRGGPRSECSAQPDCRSSQPAPVSLEYIGAESLNTMLPGEILLLDRAACLRASIESVFHAVLACPACGALGLITSLQFHGALPVVCPSKLCSCRFRIEDKNRFIYLPLN